MDKNNQSVESSTDLLKDASGSPSVDVCDQPASPPEQTQIDTTAQHTIPTELLDLINLEIDRRFQSAKDKRWAMLEKQYGDLHELSHQVEPPLPQPQASQDPSDLAERLMERAEALLNRFGLGNTPQAAALLREQQNLEGPGGYLDLIDKVIDLALHEVETANNPTPSPAGVIAPGGGSSPTSDLLDTYRMRRKQIRPGDVNSLTALKREFREKGFNIF